MNIHLKPEHSDAVRAAVDSGRIDNAVQAVEQAMTLWAQREREYAELVASLDAAEASLARGEGRPITPETMRVLVDEVLERNRHRFGLGRSLES